LLDVDDATIAEAVEVWQVLPLVTTLIDNCLLQFEEEEWDEDDEFYC